MENRKPAVAGTFYPGTFRELETVLQNLVTPGAGQPDVIGCYAPHAGYVYSGAVAGATLSRLGKKDVYIILGPSHSGLGPPFSLMPAGKWQTPLGEMEIDNPLAERLLANAPRLKADHLAHLDEHAVEVQLPFLQYLYPGAKFIPIILRDAPWEVYREIGEGIARAVRLAGADVGIIASGDMTHYESARSARLKDMRAIESMLKMDGEELMERVRTLHITMCGYAPAAVTMSALRQLGASRGELVKYQTSGDVTGDIASVVGYAGVVFMKKTESSFVKLARQTVENYVVTGAVPRITDIPPEMQGRAGVFVSLHKGGELRGCIGTIEPQAENIAMEIIQNAISSATRDPRFYPVTPAELEQLDYSVDVLTTPEPVASEAQLDAKKYGVIVQAGRRRGLLLPDLEGVDTVAEQIRICRLKGGIAPDEPVKLYRFEVKRYH